MCVCVCVCGPSFGSDLRTVGGFLCFHSLPAHLQSLPRLLVYLFILSLTVHVPVVVFKYLHLYIPLPNTVYFILSFYFILFFPSQQISLFLSTDFFSFPYVTPSVFLLISSLSLFPSPSLSFSRSLPPFSHSLSLSLSLSLYVSVTTSFNGCHLLE